VELIFLLAIRDADTHMALLKNLADLIKNPTHLIAIRDAQNTSDVTKILHSLI
jgi:mannitol/fructose-specific phosphotransferase system IIA component (Ntr-type)